MPKSLKLSRANEIAGFFIILTFALVAAAVLLGPRTRRWFTPAHKLEIQLPPEGSLGLRKGADVLILGSVVGSVEDISVTDNGDMQADVSIRGNFIRFVRSDSQAIIRKPLGIGDASIEITRGRGTPLSAGETLASVADKAPTQMMEETFNAFRNEGVPAIKELRGAIGEYTKLATELRGQEGRAQEVLEHLNHLAATLEKGDGLAAMLLNDPKPSAAVRAAIPKIDASLDDLQVTLRQTRKVAAEAVKDAAAIPRLQASAQRTLDSVPGLILQVQETSRQIQRLTEALQRNILIRGDMDATPSQTRIGADRVGVER